MISSAYNPGIPTEDNFTTPKSIIGNDDDRKIVNPNVYPYCAILALKIGQITSGTVVNSWVYGTGFLEGNDVMATAGHNMWSASYGWVDDLRIYTKHNSNSYGTSFYHPMSWTCATNYTNGTDKNYDWSAVRLWDNLGGSLGWFGKAWSSGSIANKSVAISGYPTDAGKFGYQYKDTGVLSATGITYYLVRYYDIDTSGGQSGSPVFDSNNIAWAIHTTGATSYNYGNRITEWLYTILQNMYLEGRLKWG